MSPPLVVAVVVSFNRKSTMQKTIAALRAQSASAPIILVVDNGSTDGSREWLRGQADVLLIEAHANLGGAGGFARGIAWALALDPEFLWLMDDDAVPDQACLERLLEAAEMAPDAPFFAPRVTFDDTDAPRNEPFPSARPADVMTAASDGHAAIVACAFVGPLIRARVAARIPLPVSDFFVWHDDTEYTARLAARGAGRFVPDARIRHYVTNSGPKGYVASRARANVRNLGWAMRMSRGSAIGWRAWANYLAVAAASQVSRAPARQRFTALCKTAAGIAEAGARRPQWQRPAQVRSASAASDLVPRALLDKL